MEGSNIILISLAGQDSTFRDSCIERLQFRSWMAYNFMKREINEMCLLDFIDSCYL